MGILTRDEMERYDRQIMIRGIGEEGQEKLKRARVIIAGVGGLGSPISIYLAAAGVGMIRVVDHDRVELSNLNRQILHWDKDIGTSKAASAKEKLKKLNQGVEIEAIEETITEANVSQLVAGFDLIVDAMDNLPTRYLLNKTALEKDIPFFHGAVHGLEGRAMTIIPGKSACLKCVYRDAAPPMEKFPVIGVTPAVIGCIQATEVIKYITGIGELLTNRLLIYDGLNLKFTEVKVNKDPNCEHCGHLAKEGQEGGIKVKTDISMFPDIEEHLVAKVNGSTVGQCLDDLIKQFPNVKHELFDGNGELFGYAKIYLNGESTYPEKLDKPVKDGDELHIIVAFGGDLRAKWG